MALRVHLVLLSVLFFAITTTVFSAVVPVVPATSDDTDQASLNRLLNPPPTVDSLQCKASTQRMRCYGGPLVTIQVCASQCSCEGGRISCSRFSHCDDSSMDTFCGSLCSCGLAPGVKSGSGVKKDIISHRYSTTRKSYPDDDDDLENDDELPVTGRGKRVASYLER
ncbi:hypothetical protein PV08_10155 [Exophiala spinifera]|uniref:Uncharacterized protein n=1 Tax=Exophiala spinifera TaxID=91928 RepID=A0A0D1Y7G8_9EURO|nr:uncharacterized protein PV08_10155 [Exophiala spinifera]KIW10856.1 hypothetical protein PV08_10155 [Exophiala spinifera]